MKLEFENLSKQNVPVMDKPEPMNITIVPAENKILIQTKWRFTLRNKYGNEVSLQNVYSFVINAYFLSVKDAILKIWNNKFQILAQNQHPHHTKRFDLVFQIENVSANEHWEVYLQLSHGTPNEKTHWPMRRIYLYLGSMNLYKREREITFQHHKITTFQVPAAHEFGHTIKNNIHGDEEYFGNKMMHQLDFNKKAYNNMMNIGNEVNTNYIEYILKQLKNKFDETTFIAKKIHHHK